MNVVRFAENRSLDLICMGRVAIDLYAEQVGAALEDAQSFRRYLGGCAGNIAVGSARQGLSSAMLSCVGTDDMGVFLKNILLKEGVDISLLRETPDHLTALVLLGVNPPDRFPLIFYRENCADMQIKPEQCSKNVFASSKAFLFTGTCLASEDMQKTTHHALQVAQEQGTKIIFDIDYRPVLWKLTASGDGETRFKADPFVSEQYQKVIACCDLIVGTEEEFMIAGGMDNVQQALQNIRQKTNATLVLKTGEKGCQIYTDDLNKAITGQPFPVKVLNVLGAGDAFLSGFLSAYLRDEPLDICAKYANASGALVVTRHGCAPAIPTLAEIQYFIANYDKSGAVLQSQALNLLHRKVILGEPANEPMMVLAFDHRSQFEESCREAQQDFSFIEQFKQQVFNGFLQVQASQEQVAILIDPEYGEKILNQATNDQIIIGCPIEAAGSLPLQWLASKPLYEIILQRPSAWFVKVLWQFHPEMDEKVRLIQLERLLELSQVSTSLERKLMLELIIPSEYASHNITNIIDVVYQQGIYPYWWKIAGFSTATDWQRVSEAISKYDPAARIIVLGGSSRELSEYQVDFKLAKQCSLVSGFAIGRSIFWQLWLDFLVGKVVESDIAPIIADRYSTLIKYWHNA